MNNMEDELQQSPLFAALSPQDFRRLVDRSERYSLESGEILFHAGRPCQHFYFVRDGIIQLTLIAANGHEKTIEMIRSGETFAEALLFLNQSRYPVSAIAMESSQVLGFDNALFREILEQDSHLAMRLLGQLSIRIHHLVQEIEQLTLHNAPERLGEFLLAEYKRHESPVLKIDVPKYVLASRLGMTAETFSRLMTQMVNRGILRVEGPVIQIVDVRALTSMAGD